MKTNQYWKSPIVNVYESHYKQLLECAMNYSDVLNGFAREEEEKKGFISPALESAINRVENLLNELKEVDEADEVEEAINL